MCIYIYIYIHIIHISLSLYIYIYIYIVGRLLALLAGAAAQRSSGLITVFRCMCV